MYEPMEPVYGIAILEKTLLSDEEDSLAKILIYRHHNKTYSYAILQDHILFYRAFILWLVLIL